MHLLRNLELLKSVLALPVALYESDGGGAGSSLRDSTIHMLRHVRARAELWKVILLKA